MECWSTLLRGRNISKSQQLFDRAERRWELRQAHRIGALTLLQPVALVGHAFDILQIAHGNPDHVDEVFAGAVIARFKGFRRQFAASHRLLALLQDLRQHFVQATLLPRLLRLARGAALYGRCLFGPLAAGGLGQHITGLADGSLENALPLQLTSPVGEHLGEVATLALESPALHLLAQLLDREGPSRLAKQGHNEA